MTQHAGSIGVVFADTSDTALAAWLKHQATLFTEVWCYFPTAPKASFTKQLPATVQCRTFDENEQPLNPDISAYALGRELSDAILEQLATIAPSFFTPPGTPYSLQALYQFTLTFTFARHEFNFWLNAMRWLTDAFATPEHAAIADVRLIHPIMLSEFTWPVWLKCFPILANPVCQPAVLPAAPNLSRTLQWAGRKLRWQYAAKRLWRSARHQQQVAECQGGILTFARATHHVHLMAPVWRVLQPYHPIAVLNYLPPKVLATTAKPFSVAGVTPQVFNPRAFYPQGPLIQSCYRHFSEIATKIQANTGLSDNTHAAALHQLAHLQRVSKQFFRLEAVIQSLQPKAVVGCMEADAFSLIFKELQKTTPFQTINVLHGQAPYFYTMDLCKFDAFLIWNAQTQKVLMEDGYPSAQSLAIVGHPDWDQAMPREQLCPDTASIREIRAWQGRDKLMVAYTQPGTNYTTPRQREAFLTSLLDYLRAHPGVKLLVKKHPNELDKLTDDALAAAQDLAARVRLYHANNLALYPSIGLADVVVSICSTVLLEALFYHVPALALDFDRVNDVLGNGMDCVTPIIDNPAQVNAIITEVLAQGMHASCFDATARDQMFPTFALSYDERIRHVLQQLHLLPNTVEILPHPTTVG